MCHIVSVTRSRSSTVDKPYCNDADVAASKRVVVDDGSISGEENSDAVVYRY